MGKSDTQIGLETILNNPKTSFLKHPDVFHEIMKQSGMPLTAAIKHIGKGKKAVQFKQPSDEERSKMRLEAMDKTSS